MVNFGLKSDQLYRGVYLLGISFVRLDWAFSAQKQSLIRYIMERLKQPNSRKLHLRFKLNFHKKS